MAIQWSGDDEPPRRRKRPAWMYSTLVGVPLEIGEGTLPNARKPRDVLVIAIIVLLIVAAGVAFWLLGPLPRVFPLIS